MIASAWFKDFKLLRDVRLELGRLNVVVGRNGVGKSTVLEGLHLLMQLATEQPDEDTWRTGRPGRLFSGPRAVERLVSRPDARSFELGLETAERVQFGVRAGLAPEADQVSEHFHLWFGPEDEAERLDLPGSHPNPRLFFAGPYGAKLGAVVRLKLHAETLAADHYSERERPRIEYDGTGLASVLQYVQGLRDGTLEAIEADLARVVPNARRVRTLPAKIRRRERVRVSLDGQESWHDQWREFTGTRFEVEFTKLGWIQADQLSEGTLLALGLITLLRHLPPRVVLLDDVDKALHPVAQRELIDLTRAVLEDLPHVQVIATSHSPFVLDALSATETFVAGAVDETSSRVLRLDAHPAWEKRKGFMHPGEFWSAVGEGWVAESAS